MYAIYLNIIEEVVQHNKTILDCRTVWQRRLKNHEVNCLFNLFNNEFRQNFRISKNIFNTIFETSPHRKEGCRKGAVSKKLKVCHYILIIFEII